jgi:hypothetical protein
MMSKRIWDAAKAISDVELVIKTNRGPGLT